MRPPFRHPRGRPHPPQPPSHSPCDHPHLAPHRRTVLAATALAPRIHRSALTLPHPLPTTVDACRTPRSPPGRKSKENPTHGFFSGRKHWALAMKSYCHHSSSSSSVLQVLSGEGSDILRCFCASVGLKEGLLELQHLWESPGGAKQEQPLQELRD